MGVQTSAYSSWTLLKPRKRNWRKPRAMLDLANHRLDRLPAQAVARAAPGAPELGRHRGHPRAGLDGGHRCATVGLPCNLTDGSHP